MKGECAAPEQKVPRSAERSRPWLCTGLRAPDGGAVPALPTGHRNQHLGPETCKERSRVPPAFCRGERPPIPSSVETSAPRGERAQRLHTRVWDGLPLCSESTSPTPSTPPPPPRRHLRGHCPGRGGCCPDAGRQDTLPARGSTWRSASSERLLSQGRMAGGCPHRAHPRRARTAVLSQLSLHTRALPALWAGGTAWADPGALECWGAQPGVPRVGKSG